MRGIERFRIERCREVRTPQPVPDWISIEFQNQTDLVVGVQHQPADVLIGHRHHAPLNDFARVVTCGESKDRAIHDLQIHASFVGA
jgi:hypothetical protein